MKLRNGRHKTAITASGRLRAMLDHCSHFIGLLRTDGTVAEVNRTALAFRGLRRWEVIGRPLWQTRWWDISPATRRRLKAAVAEAATGRPVRWEADLLGPDGAAATFDVSLDPVATAGSRIDGLIFQAQDITERKRVEEALRNARDALESRVQHAAQEISKSNQALSESERRMRAILDTAADGIIVINESGAIQSANPAALRLFGYSMGQIFGKNIKMLMPEPYRAQHDGYLRNYMRTGRARIIGIGREVVGKRSDGTTFPMDLAVSETRLAQGRIFTGFVRDVTERRRLEKEILQISGKEQRRIGQDLHDGLCQQLAGIAYASEVLKNKLQAKGSPEASTVRDIAKLVDDAITQARGLARGLTPVRLEADGLAAALRELAHNVTELFRITCRFQYHQRVPVEDNETATHLYRIAQEAVSNAIKHGRPARIGISLGRIGDRLVLSVNDDGRGLTKLPTKTKGMGLNSMNYRSRVIGGSFDIRPNPAGGTTVTCSIPLLAKIN